MYLCVFCGYSTDKKNNFLRHLKTERHKDIFNKRIDTTDKDCYHCLFCKYQNKKKNNYLIHINLCMMKNLNKSIQKDYTEHNSQTQHKFKAVNRFLTTDNKQKTKEMEFYLQIIERLFKENYINDKILNDRKIWSINERDNILSIIKCDKNIKTNEKDTVLMNIEKQVNDKVTTIYLNNINKLQNYDKMDNFYEKKNTNNCVSVFGSNIETEHKSNENDSENDSKNDSENDSENDSFVESLEFSNNNKMKKIRDCGRLYFYDEQNNVFNDNNEKIGVREHDECCPNQHKNNCTNDNCWWYVEYIK